MRLYFDDLTIFILLIETKFIRLNDILSGRDNIITLNNDYFPRYLIHKFLFSIITKWQYLKISY